MLKPQAKIANCAPCGLRYTQMDQQNREKMNANLVAEETPVRNVGMPWYLECGYPAGGGLTPLAPPPPVSAPSTPLAPPPPVSAPSTPLAPPPVSAPSSASMPAASSASMPVLAEASCASSVSTAVLLASKDDAIARALDNHPAVAGEPPCPSSPTSPSTEADWGP